jgi:hypothetical protein
MANARVTDPLESRLGEAMKNGEERKDENLADVKKWGWCGAEV